MKYLFLVIFAVSTAFHLYASVRKDRKLRNISKPFILLALLGYYLTAAVPVVTSVVLALIFSWLGDVLLMGKGVKWFTAGGIAFMISHGFFVAAYLRDVRFAAIHPALIAVLALVFIGLVTLIFSRLKPYLPKLLFYPMFLYLLINGTMNCFAIFRWLSLRTPMSFVTVVGAVLFFISDASLFFVRFHKESRQKNHFWVMLTYSVGELLIVLGLVH